LEKRAQQVLPGSEGFGEKKEEAELGGGRNGTKYVCIYE
jgi:hypothetical protein